MAITIFACNVELTGEDIRRVRSAMLRSGLPASYADYFGEEDLFSSFSWWNAFVHAVWDEEEPADYIHDLWCRDHIQLAIENSTPPTRASIEGAVGQIDDLFRSKMRPAATVLMPSELDLREGPYFWRSGVIHPRLAVAARQPDNRLHPTPR
jgi:hypothetical protein